MDQGSIGAVEVGLQFSNSEVLTKHKKLLEHSLSGSSLLCTYSAPKTIILVLAWYLTEPSFLNQKAGY